MHESGTTQTTPHEFDPTVAGDLNPVIPNSTLDSWRTMDGIAIAWQEGTAAARSAGPDLDWVYGHQHARDCTRKDRRPRFYDKDGRQPYREWARRRTQHQYARKSAAFRERTRIMHTFFIPLLINAPGRNRPRLPREPGR
jgi:hypothetical protein